jgi:hypothetical protein
MDTITKNVQYINKQVQKIMVQEKNIVIFIISIIILISLFANFIPIGFGEFFENPIIMLIYLLGCFYLFRINSTLAIFLLVLYLLVLSFTNKSRIEEIYKSAFGLNVPELMKNNNSTEKYIVDQLNTIRDTLASNNIKENMIDGSGYDNVNAFVEQLKAMYSQLLSLPVTNNQPLNNQVQQQIIDVQQILESTGNQDEYDNEIGNNQWESGNNQLPEPVGKPYMTINDMTMENETTLDKQFETLDVKDTVALPINDTEVGKILYPGGDPKNQMHIQGLGLGGLPGVDSFDRNGSVIRD